MGALKSFYNSILISLGGKNVEIKLESVAKTRKSPVRKTEEKFKTCRKISFLYENSITRLCRELRSKFDRIFLGIPILVF